MSKTFRRTKHGKVNDGEPTDFLYRHDSKQDRENLNKSFKREEQQYFERFGEVKYNQKPKSRGWKTW